MKGTEDVPPNSWHISNTFDALKGLVHLSADAIEPPQFLDDEVHDGKHLIPVRNGLLDVSTGELDEPNPLLFNLYAIDVDYDPDGECPHWLAFLAQLWPNDQQSIDCLQEIFGYVLEDKNDQQKAFMIIGPKRSGKGTIARVLARLKAGNVAKPGLKDFTTQFGLEQLIGKSFAIVSDARLDNKNVDVTFAVERILSITGGDKPSIPRKFKSNYEPGVDTVFLVLANELPMLPDASGALPHRFILLRIFVSFFGHEDTALFAEKLEPEISGILNWAIAGWFRLHVLPETSQAELEGFVELSNPLARFYADRVTLIPASEWKAQFATAEEGFLVGKETLHQAYVTWCQGHDRRPKHYDHFFRDVAATGVDTNYRWDPFTHTSRNSKGEKAERWVRGMILL